MASFKQGILAFFLLFTISGYGQISSSYWQAVDEASLDQSAEISIQPDRYHLVHLDVRGTREFIANTGLSRNNSWVIEIPLPDGTFEQFEVRRNQVMPEELLQQFPQLGTFTGTSLTNPGKSIYMDISPAGLHAMTKGGGSSVFVDPYFKNSDQFHVSYYRKDFRRAHQPRFSCDFVNPKSDNAIDPSPHKEDELKSERNYKAAVVTKEYELAIAVTGEYTALFGGTVAGGLAAVMTAVNRVTGVYETEVGVSLALVPNNNLIIYTDPNSDPYNNNSGDLNLVQNDIDMNIGSANYDIGHVFTSSNGGVASLGVVCIDGSKARGLTGLPDPTGDPFYIDYVAHEMGHQFDGLHTFNGDSGACAGGNRSPTAAYEPGSGSTIMAYAGICGNDNLQSNSDPYFHLKSLMQITDLVNGTAATCATVIDVGNIMPVSDANFQLIDGITIPASTPFELLGNGTDANPGDALTYQWDEFDLGPPQDVNAGDNGSSPIFRSWEPVTHGKRIFPRLVDLLNNTTTVGETLPTTDRTLDMELVVRDNVGGWMNDQITLNVASAAGPFEVTSQNMASTVSGMITVTWDEAGTTGNGINCANVNITLSTNGGVNFPISLASNTPNDGTQEVTLPEIFANKVRIKVKCSDNIFFDLNNEDLIIEPSSIPCNTTTEISNDPIADGTYSSDTDLTASGRVPANGNVLFTADNTIELLDPFTVEETGVFEARLFPCTN